jgi:histone deacetylase 1/2
MQSDNGGEFLTTALREYFSTHGISLRLSCPYTSPQNRRAERLIRTHNDIVRTLLFQASLPPHFWAEALLTANHLLNIRPSRAINNHTPHFLLYGTHPIYDHLRTFGCLCFPNLASTAAHKLEPRSTRYIFIGYPREQKGYRCLDLTTRRVIISRHIVFNETNFPYTQNTPAPSQPTATHDPQPPDPIHLGSWPNPTCPVPPTSSSPASTTRSPPNSSTPLRTPLDPIESSHPSPPATPTSPPSPPAAPTSPDTASPGPPSPTRSPSCSPPRRRFPQPKPIPALHVLVAVHHPNPSP